MFSVNTRESFLKDKKDVAITNDFQKVLDESNRKRDKILVDKGSEFFNKSMKSWMQINDIEIYSAHNQVNLLLLKYLLEP